MTLSDKATIRAVRKSIKAVLSGDRPRDWKESLADASDALADLLTKPNSFRGISESDLLTYLELARVALRDADTFDDVAASMDISDGEMIRLRDQVTALMGGRV